MFLSFLVKIFLVETRHLWEGETVLHIGPDMYFMIILIQIMENDSDFYSLKCALTGQ